jgi:hypothetical protein
VKVAAGTPAQQRRQLLTLAALLVILAFVYFRFVAQAPTEVPAAASNTPAATPRGAESVQTLPEAIKLSALKDVREETKGPRDPFGFGVPPRPPEPPPPPPQPIVAQPEVPRQPVGPPPRPQIPVKFLGLAEDPSRPGKLVSLSINGAVTVVREGDIVDGKYRLLKVGLESIVMAYLDGQGQQTIRLGG